MQKKINTVDELIQWIKTSSTGDTIYVHEDVRIEAYVSDRQISKTLQDIEFTDMGGKVWLVELK